MRLKKIGSLEIEPQALDKKIIFWKVQKISIIILTIFLILVILGITGRGILTPVTASTADNTLSIQYDPFARANAFNQLQINITENVRDQIQIFISNQYLNNMEIKQITPKPLKTELHNEFIIYTFSGITDHYQINFIFEPHTIGLLKGNIGKLGSDGMTFTQLIFP